MKDKDLLEKYRTTMNGYIEKGHAEMVPEEELNTITGLCGSCLTIQ